MFSYKTTKDLLYEERKKTAELQANLYKVSADIEYIAMMTDVELEESDNDEV